MQRKRKKKEIKALQDANADANASIKNNPSNTKKRYYTLDAIAQAFQVHQRVAYDLVKTHVNSRKILRVTKNERKKKQPFMLIPEREVKKILIFQTLAKKRKLECA